MDLASSDFFPPGHQPGLFRSAAWLTAWYETWGQHPTVTLSGGAAPTTVEEELQQIIAFTRPVICKCMPITNAFPLGLSTNLAPSIRSEYFFFGAGEMHASQQIGNYLDNALRYRWDQFYLADMLRSSPEFNVLLDEAGKRELKVFTRKTEPTYAVDVHQQNFEEYLRSLGKNTRLKLFNRRTNLTRMGDLKVENIWPDRKKFFQLLDEFHKARWGKTCYRGKNLKFINRLLDHLSQSGHEIDFSVLTIADKPISAVFDIRFQGRQYNLQTGYLQDFHKSISLGTLHFGYQIEAAFKNPDIFFYDFMAGNGKHANYKKSLANRSDEFVTIVLVRSALLKFIYLLQGLWVHGKTSPKNSLG